MIAISFRIMDTSSVSRNAQKPEKSLKPNGFHVEICQHVMVYVCHYSSRKGYQTFCVPEGDSDILRFYAHDYCGPCEGGQGVTWGDMTI